MVAPSHADTSNAAEYRRAFGQVVSTDFPLPRLPLGPRSGAPSVIMAASGRSWDQPVPLDRDADRFTRETCSEGVRYVAGGIGEFLIHDEGRRITYSLAPDAPIGDVQHILTGPALVMALQLQGQFFLHAAAFERDGAMFALSAPSGFGKSTLAASLVDAGCTVHSDDVVPLRELDGTIVGRQGQPWIKLWDSALDAFGKDAADFDEVLEGFGKRVVPAITSSDAEVPLRGIFLLAPHLKEDAPIEVRELRRLDGALAIMGNSYSPEILVGPLAASTLSFAARIAETVPVRVISYYRSFENLPAIREAILRDVEEVTGAHA